MSNPCSMGRNKAAVRAVLSMIVGRPWLCGDVGDLAVIGYVVFRIARGLDVDGPRVLVDQSAQRLRLARVEESDLDPQLCKGLREKSPSPAVEAGGRDEVLSGVDDREQRGRNGRLAAGEDQPCRTAVERRKTLLEHVGRGIHQPRIDIAKLAQAEEVRRMLRVMKHVTGRGVDRHRAGGRGGIGRLTGV